MNAPPPPPPAPGQIERAAHAAAAENERALASPVIRFNLSCVSCDSAAPPLQPARTQQRLMVHVHAARTQGWFWMCVQQHLARLRDGCPVFPNCFIDPALQQATIDLTNVGKPPPAANPSGPPPLHPPPPPPHRSDNRDQWWTIHGMHVADCEQLPPPSPASTDPSLPSASGVSDQCWAALRLGSGRVLDFDQQCTLADAGVIDGCVLSLAVRQHEGFLPSC